MEELLSTSIAFNGGAKHVKTRNTDRYKESQKIDKRDLEVSRTLSEINKLIDITPSISYNTVSTNLSGGDKTFDYPISSVLLVEDPLFIQFIQKCNLISEVARIASNSIIIIPSEEQINEMIKYYHKLAKDNQIENIYSAKMNTILLDRNVKFPWNNYFIRGRELNRIDYKNDINNAFPKATFIEFSTQDKNDHERVISPIPGSKTTINIKHACKGKTITITCEYVARQQNGVYLFRAIDDRDGLRFDDSKENPTKVACNKTDTVSKTIELVEFYQSISKGVHVMANNLMKQIKKYNKDYDKIYTPDKTVNLLNCIDKCKTLPNGWKLEEDITDADICPETFDNESIMKNIKKTYKKYNKLGGIINRDAKISDFIREMNKLRNNK